MEYDETGIDDEMLCSPPRRDVYSTPKKSDVLADALARALEEEHRLANAYGGEPPLDGSVIAFRARFVPGGQVYDYAAIRSNGLWSTTGPKSPKSYTWSELVAWMDGLDRITKYTVLRAGRKNRTTTNTKEN